MNMSDDRAEFVQYISYVGLLAWRTGDMAAIGNLLTDDVEFISPTAVGGAARGKDAVLSHLTERRPHTTALHLVDILVGVSSFTLLMRAEAGHTNWHVEPDDNGRVRRIVVSFSVGPKLMDPLPTI